MYNVHYHFAGSAVRDYPVWFTSIRDEWTGKPQTIHYTDDGFGNLVPTDPSRRLLLIWRYGNGQGH